MNNSLKIIGLTAVLATVLEAAGPIVERNTNQRERIRQGVASGQLTRRETARLEFQERQLHREIAHDRFTGGGLSLRERAQIDHRQNVLSREIYNEKHDAQRRPW